MQHVQGYVNKDQTIFQTGFVWDNENFSCAYDSFFTVLWSLWQDDPIARTASLSSLSAEMRVLVDGFTQILRGQKTFEAVRDSVREILHFGSLRLFPVGHHYTAASDVAANLLSGHINGSAKMICGSCGYSSEDVITTFFLHLTMSSWTTSSTSVWLQNHLKRLVQNCPQCSIHGLDRPISRMTSTTTIRSMPPVLFLEIPILSEYSVDPKLTLGSEHEPINMILRGVIYHGSNHFVSRIISGTGDVWFHDGIATGRHCIYEGNISNPDLLSGFSRHGGKKAVAALYA
jgi:hypothetical protein